MLGELDLLAGRRARRARGALRESLVIYTELEDPTATALRACAALGGVARPCEEGRTKPRSSLPRQLERFVGGYAAGGSRARACSTEFRAVLEAAGAALGRASLEPRPST